MVLLSNLSPPLLQLLLLLLPFTSRFAHATQGNIHHGDKWGSSDDDIQSQVSEELRRHALEESELSAGIHPLEVNSSNEIPDTSLSAIKTHLGDSSYDGDDEHTMGTANSAKGKRQRASAALLPIGDNIDYLFNESLRLRPLPNNHLLASFKFDLESEPFTPNVSPLNFDRYTHYTVFPKSLKPILDRTSTRQLHLRFTRGFWDTEVWGRLPHQGFKSGGSGVELWAIIEAESKERAYRQWKSLVNSLGGLFCASVNFIDSSRTTYPIFSFQPEEAGKEGLPLFNDEHELYLVHASLANEPVCTENLTPLVKLLPTKGKAGLSSLLDGHKVFDSLWHNLAIDLNTKCDTDECRLEMEANVDMVVHVPSVLARNKNPIPKPLSGEELRCDMDKPFDIYQCFPAPEETNVEFSLTDIFGKSISGGSRLSKRPSEVCVDIVDPWVAMAEINGELYLTDDNCFELHDTKPYNFVLRSPDTSTVKPVEDSPVFVSRSLTGYSQDSGGLRIVFNNPSENPVRLVYFESLPWFMRVFLSSLKLEVYSETYGHYTLNDVIKSAYYKPAKDRSRPTHLEFLMEIPANTTLALSYHLDKGILHFAEYPPDANHGFEIESAVITVLSPTRYQFRTSTLLLYLATPDFSMPYNVIVITSTVMGMLFSSVFGLLTKRLYTVEEAERIVATKGLQGKLRQLGARLVSKFRNKFGPRLKSKAA